MLKHHQKKLEQSRLRMLHFKYSPTAAQIPLNIKLMLIFYFAVILLEQHQSHTH